MVRSNNPNNIARCLSLYYPLRKVTAPVYGGIFAARRAKEKCSIPKRDFYKQRKITSFIRIRSQTLILERRETDSTLLATSLFSQKANIIVFRQKSLFSFMMLLLYGSSS